MSNILLPQLLSTLFPLSTEKHNAKASGAIAKDQSLGCRRKRTQTEKKQNKEWFIKYTNFPLTWLRILLRKNGGGILQKRPLD